MRSTARYWYDSLIWLLYTVAGILIPVVISLIVLAGLKSDITVGAFTNGGQFAVYSAAMWATVYYLMAKPAWLRLPLTEIFGLICFLGFALAITLFVLATILFNDVNVSQSLLQWPSIGLFGISAITAFIAMGLENRRLEADPRDQRKRAQQTLEQDFDETDAE